MKGTIKIWFSPIRELYHFTCEIKLCLEAFETVAKGQLFWERTLISSPFLSLWLLGALTAECMLCAKRLPAVHVFLYEQSAHLWAHLKIYLHIPTIPKRPACSLPMVKTYIHIMLHCKKKNNKAELTCTTTRVQNPPSPHLRTQIRNTEKQKRDPGLIQQARTRTLLRVDAFCWPVLTCVLPNVWLLFFSCGGIIWGISRCCETWFPQW